jgi:hypothetical protein
MIFVLQFRFAVLFYAAQPKRFEMNSTNPLMHLLIPVLKPREDRIAPARCVRLMQTQHGVALYNEDRWGGLPPRIANAYARFEDKSKLAIRERSLM